MSRVPLSPILGEPSPSPRRRHSQAGSSHSATHTIRDILPPLGDIERNEPETPKSPRRYISRATLSYFSPGRRVQTTRSMHEPPPFPSPTRRFSPWISSHSSKSHNEESPRSKKAFSYHHPLSMLPLLNYPSTTSPRRQSTASDANSVAELESVCSFAEEEYMPSVLTQYKALELIQKIRGIIEVQKKRDREINEQLEEEKELAKARFQHGNETGAVLAMKKVNRLSHEGDRVKVARDVATDALVDIQAATRRAKVKAFRDIGPDTAEPYKVDIGEENARVLLEIQEILDGTPEVVADKNKLVQQLKELF